jgi:hypothetical protein
MHKLGVQRLREAEQMPARSVLISNMPGMRK